MNIIYILAFFSNLVLLLGKVTAQQGSALLVTGHKLAPIGGNVSVYNSTRETSFSNQLINSFPNGITYWWDQSSGTFAVGVDSAGTQFRALLRFEEAHRYVPAGAVVHGAELSVTFVNWNVYVAVQGCFVRRPWSAKEATSERFKSTGWLFSQWNGTASLNWTEPGGWADCSPDYNISFVVPANGRDGYWVRTIPLDARMVAAWLANGGAANFGLMFRATNGTVNMVTSLWRNGTLYRPALTIKYDTTPGAVQPPAEQYPVNATAVPRTWWVGPEGHDELNSGHPQLPFRSPARALVAAWPGDSIYLMSGTYGGGLSVYRPRITLQSAPGHWAILSLPLTDPRDGVNVVTLFPGADGGVLRNLEITGGHYYGIMFFTSWADYGTTTARVASASAPSHWVLQNLRIHDTGSSGVKMVMKAVNNTFLNCEFFNTGERLRTTGYGIDIVQSYDIKIRDCYFHDMPSSAVSLAGGSARVVIERNYVERTDRGLELGGWTDPELMDTINNPDLYECINVTARNNIISTVRQAGIVTRAARGAIVAHNTIWRVQEGGQAGVLLDGANHWRGGVAVPTPCSGVVLWGNLVVRSATARAGPLVQIRSTGLLNTTTPAGFNISLAPAIAALPGLTMAFNVYYDQAGMGPTNGSFAWGQGAMLEDQRAGSNFLGNTTGWARHCNVTLKLPYADVNSVEANPQLDAGFAPLSCSPARDRVPAVTPGGEVLAVDDFHGRQRPGPGPRDAGAVQYDSSGGGGGSNNATSAKPIPPVPAAFAAYEPFRGIGLDRVYDFTWPYYYWLGRACRDIVVDAVLGNDNQAYDYYSNYSSPFRTLAIALKRHNQCDRILLRAGQAHAGGVTITQTNLTITTHPADLPARAFVQCSGTGNTTCLFVYGAATALTFTGFDVLMGRGSNGSCIHLNEGAGSGTSSYWSFYAANSRRGGPLVSTFKNMSLTNCGIHGIKLSTFVAGVTLEALNITNATSAGVYVVGGRDVTVRRCNILNPGESGIRLGSGVRNVLVEGNLIRNYGGIGILLGSEASLVSYGDVDWARIQPPDWHDCINATVRNNIVDGGAGAGIAFYSARDAVVVHNTFLRVAASMHAGVLLNVSPKQLGPTEEVGPPNTNITFRNNIVTLPPETRLRLVVQTRILQGAVVNRALTVVLPNGTCDGSAGGRRLLGDGEQWELVDRGAGAAAAARSARAADFGSSEGISNVVLPRRDRIRRWHEGASAISTTAGVHIGATGAPHPWLSDGMAVDDQHDSDGGNDKHWQLGTTLMSAYASEPSLTAAAEQQPWQQQQHQQHRRRRQLVQTPASFVLPYINDKREQGRDPDGSCPIYPDSHPWHLDVSALAVHPRSEAIKSNIGLKTLHLDFGFPYTINGTTLHAGMPINVVDSRNGTPRMPVVFGPNGYPDESELEPGGLPFPDDAAVQNAFPGCGDPPCRGDRHLLVLDNATCLLYEAWRSFPPSVTRDGTWQVDSLAKFNLSRNGIERPLGSTSADAAGLAILPGLVRWEEIAVKGVIDHAIRFTGPNSRPAYALPATHYAPAGYDGRDAPYMGMRVRLNASYDCVQLRPAAQIVCEALKKYGLVFADNGLPWDLAGEATSKWANLWQELVDVQKIPSSAMEVIDLGCICVNAGCTVAECNGLSWMDPNAPQVYPAIKDSAATLDFAFNIYSKGLPEGGLYVDQRVPPFASGYSGGLAGWGAYLGPGQEAGSSEQDPGIDPVTFRPLSTSAARCVAQALPGAVAGATDFYGRSRNGSAGGDRCTADAGAVMAT